MLQNAGEHFAGGDGSVQLSGKRGMPLGIIGVKWLLDPGQVVLFQPAAHPHGRRSVPLLIGIDHHRDPAVDTAMHRFDSLQVGRGVGMPDLDLDAADTRFDRLLDIVQYLVDRRGQETPDVL